LLADYAAELFDYVVDILTDSQLGYALSIARATVDKLARCELIVFNLKNYLLAAGACCSERFHIRYLLVSAFFIL
jgi:hypothetical protein